MAKSSISSFEVLITVIGISVSFILGWGQYQLGQRQNELLREQLRSQQLATINQIEIQAMETVSDYLGHLGKDTEKGKQAEKVVLATAEFLSAEYQRTALAEIAKRLIEDSEVVDTETQTRLIEATNPADSNAPWFAVIATFKQDKLSSREKSIDRKWEEIQQIDKDLKVSLYLSQNSEHYILTLGEGSNKQEANELAQQAKTLGWSKKPFVLRENNWEKVGEAPFTNK